ncbi:VCBS repeat-containing protein [bacterium]|nr:VCBS repeat-containing protein [bacterium]
MKRHQTLSALLSKVLVPLLAVAILSTGNPRIELFAAEVNLDGSLSHSIPLVLPEGVNGTAPALSFEYNSNSKTGLLGHGWNLAGLPAITRMNWGEGIRYNSGDTYIGPGGRLVDVKGDKSVYHTEDESWGKYIPQGSCPSLNEPCSWILYTKEGNKLYFGATDNSRIEAISKSGQVRVWALNKFEDVHGNSWEVDYYEAYGDYTPQSITYTYGNGVTAAYKITFNYENRSHSFTTYEQSTHVVRKKRLKEVKIATTGGTLIRSYQLNYHMLIPNSGIDRLTSIFEYGSDGTSSREVATFQYSPETPFSRTTQEAWTTNEKTDSWTFFDYDRDGDKEMVLQFENTLFIKDPLTTQQIATTSFPSDIAVSSNGMVDVDGDRREEIIRYSDGFKIIKLASDGSHVEENWLAAVHEMHDFTLVMSQSAPSDYAIKSYSDLHTWKTTDINGDGKTDLLIVRVHEWNEIYGCYEYKYSIHGEPYLEYVCGTKEVKPKTFNYYAALSNGSSFNTPQPISALAATSFGGTDSNIKFTSDLDGDGKADIIRFTFDGGFFVLRSQGQEFETEANWIPSGNPVNVGHPYSYLQPQPNGSSSLDAVYKEVVENDLYKWTVGDWNGDGKPDLIYARIGSYDERKGCYDYEKQGGEGSIATHCGIVSVKPKSFHFYVALNNGSGFEPPQMLWSRNGDMVDLEVGDFNGDRRTDVLIINKVINYTSPALGSYAYRVAGDISFLFSGGEPNSFIRYYMEDIESQELTAWSVVDLEGDGRDDIFFWDYIDPDEDKFKTYKTASGTRDNLLTLLSNDIGGQTTVEYYPGRAPVSFQMNNTNCGSGTGEQICGVPNASNKPLVFKITGSDGRADSFIKSYNYVNGRIFPGTVQEREDLGFEQVIETDHQTGNVGFTELHQDKPFQYLPGLIRQSSQAGKVFSQKEIEYEDLKPHGTVPDIRQIQSTETIEKEYEFSSGFNPLVYTKTVSVTSRDQFGFPLETLECYHNDWSSSVEDKCLETKTTYEGHSVNPLTSSLDNWRLGQIETVITRDQNNQNILSGSKFEYDANGNIENIYKIYCRDAESCYSENWIIAEQNRQYDNTGSLTSTMDSRGYRAWNSYDAVFHYPAASTSEVVEGNSGLNLLTQKPYDSRGRLEESIDVNGNSVFYTYDVFNRLRTETDDLVRITYEYPNLGNPSHQYKQKTISDLVGQTPDYWTRTYFDGLNRNYKTESKGDNDTVIVTQTIEFYGNSLNKEIKRSQPYFSGDPIIWTHETYDVSGRLVKVNHPDGSKLEYDYSTPGCRIKEEELVKEIMTGPPELISRETTECFNAAGSLISKIDALGNQTDYTYDPLERVTSAKLPKGNDGINYLNRVTYDSLGRKTSLTEPSTGLTTYAYEAATNNPLQRTDAMNRTTHFQYDGLSRVTSQWTTASSGDEITDSRIGYTYDLPAFGGTDENPKGKLTKVVNAAGSIEYAYTTQGNPSRITRDFYDLSGYPGPMTERFTYDYAGRLLKSSFPDSTGSWDGYQEYAYSEAGNLSQVGLLNTIAVRFTEYNASGRMIKKETNTPGSDYQVISDYTYTNRGRLKKMQTHSVCRPGESCQSVDGYSDERYVAQDLDNGYDGAGNVQWIRDNRENSFLTSDEGDNTDTGSTREFEYDTLDRLTTATAEETYGTKEYQYDTIGNMTYMEGLEERNFEYDGMKVTSGSDIDVLYDEAGNMIQKTQNGTIWRYGYDDQNRLTQVHRKQPGNPEQQTLEIAYDFTGQRIKKVFFDPEEGKTVTTWYFGESLELRQINTDHETNQFIVTRHVFAKGHGKFVTLTEDQPTVIMDTTASAILKSYRDEENRPLFSGLMAISNLHPKNNRTTGRFYDPPLSVYQEDDTFVLVIQIGIISFCLLLLLLLPVNRFDKTSRFSSFHRWTGLFLTLIFLVVSSCKEPGITKSRTSGYAGETVVTGDNPGEEDSGNIGPETVLEALASGRMPYYGSMETLSLTSTTTGPVPGTWFYHQDHIGSSTVITDAEGNEATRIAYLPYGEIDMDHSTGTETITHKFTGQELDEETGLMYYNARFYDPGIGRFLTPDTIVPDQTNAQAFNRYAYVINNPIRYTDPTGHNPKGDGHEWGYEGGLSDSEKERRDQNEAPDNPDPKNNPLPEQVSIWDMVFNTSYSYGVTETFVIVGLGILVGVIVGAASLALGASTQLAALLAGAASNSTVSAASEFS